MNKEHDTPTEFVTPRELLHPLPICEQNFKYIRDSLAELKNSVARIEGIIMGGSTEETLSLCARVVIIEQNFRKYVWWIRTIVAALIAVIGKAIFDHFHEHK